MSNVSLSHFKSRFAEELEITDLETLEASLDSISEFDSMGKLVISVLIEELFGIQIEYEILESQETLEELYEYCVLSGS